MIPRVLVIPRVASRLATPHAIGSSGLFLKRKARSALDQELAVELDLKRAELSGEEGKSSVDKQKELIQFEDELRQKSNERYAELVDKQARIFEQVKPIFN